VQITEGRNDRAGVKIGTRGVATNVLGRLDLNVRVEPPAQPGALHAMCNLVFECGKSVHTLSVPIKIQFTYGPLTPDVSRVVFSGETEQLKGQERCVEFRDRAEGGEFVVEAVPDWLECRVKPTSNNACLVTLKISDRPPRQSVTRTVQVRRAKSSDVSVPLPVHVFIAQP
jgi:hypothetical protein